VTGDGREFLDEELEEEHGVILVHLAVGTVHGETMAVEETPDGIEALAELGDDDVLDIRRSLKDDRIEVRPSPGEDACRSVDG